MSYVLDVNNKRVKSAMETLGIDKDELLVKTLPEFGHKGTREEIKQLRFESYSRRLEETVKQIKELIRPKNIKLKPDQVKSISVTPDDDPEDVKTTEEAPKVEKKTFINEKNKEILITALEQIKEETVTTKRKERPKSIAQPRSVKMSKIEQFKKTQQANFAKIKDQEEIKVRKALSQSFRCARPSRLTPRNKDLNTSSMIYRNSFGAQNVEQEISQKLAKFEEKLERSRILHEQQILMKRESARSQQSVTKMSSLSPNNDQLIIKIIEREKNINERKQQKLQTLKEKWEKIKLFKEQRVKRIEEIEKEYKKVIKEKEASLDKKLNAADKIIKNRKESIGKDIEIKIEIQKLKDEDAKIKVKRAQNMMKKKKEEIIEKQIAENLKLEATKQVSELSNTRRREKAIQEMIEKERVNEVIFLIKKSPQSKIAVELMKEFKMVPEKLDSSEND